MQRYETLFRRTIRLSPNTYITKNDLTTEVAKKAKPVKNHAINICLDDIHLILFVLFTKLYRSIAIFKLYNLDKKSSIFWGSVSSINLRFCLGDISTIPKFLT